MTKSTHTVGGRAAGVKNPNPTHRRQQFDIIRELMHGPKTCLLYTSDAADE